MNEKRTRRRQCAGTLGECEEKNAGRDHRRTRARLSQSWWRHHFVVHPKQTPSKPLFPRRESPKRKRKNGIGILRVGTPPPQRSATTTASFSSSDDHSPRNRFRVPRSRSHRPPPVAFVQGARFFFFRSRHHKRKRPNKTNLRAANRPRRFATGARTSETRGPRPFASLLFFAPQKNVPFFSSSSSSSSSAAATLWRVLNAFVWRSKCVSFWGEKR